jgi:hypothetical protein
MTNVTIDINIKIEARSSSCYLLVNFDKTKGKWELDKKQKCTKNTWTDRTLVNCKIIDRGFRIWR